MRPRVFVEELSYVHTASGAAILFGVASWSRRNSLGRIIVPHILLRITILVSWHCDSRDVSKRNSTLEVGRNNWYRTKNIGKIRNSTVQWYLWGNLDGVKYGKREYDN